MLRQVTLLGTIALQDVRGSQQSQLGTPWTPCCMCLVGESYVRNSCGGTLSNRSPLRSLSGREHRWVWKRRVKVVVLAVTKDKALCSGTMCLRGGPLKDHSIFIASSTGRNIVVQLFHSPSEASWDGQHNSS